MICKAHKLTTQWYVLPFHEGGIFLGIGDCASTELEIYENIYPVHRPLHYVEIAFVYVQMSLSLLLVYNQSEIMSLCSSFPG